MTSLTMLVELGLLDCIGTTVAPDGSISISEAANDAKDLVEDTYWKDTMIAARQGDRCIDIEGRARWTENSDLVSDMIT